MKPFRIFSMFWLFVLITGLFLSSCGSNSNSIPAPIVSRPSPSISTDRPAPPGASKPYLIGTTEKAEDLWVEYPNPNPTIKLKHLMIKHQGVGTISIKKLNLSLPKAALWVNQVFEIKPRVDLELEMGIVETVSKIKFYLDGNTDHLEFWGIPGGTPQG